METSIVAPAKDGDAPNSPGLTPDARQHLPALSNIGQAAALVKSLQSENTDRTLKNSRILEKYNAERPYDPNKLRADGLSWKTNFTTKPLTTLIDKVVPRFVTALRNMRYITASKLPDRFPNASEKTEEFRREITETCRGHEGWDEFLSEIAQENVLFGYVAAGWLDSYTWFPRYFRQDAFLVPQGTKHAAKSAPVVCLKDSYFLHELFDLIRNPAAAKTAGWDVDNVVEAINNASPADRRSGASDVTRVYADLTRESSVISSFTGAKTVECWHVLIAEVDGRVTHVAFEEKSGKQLFWLEKQFERMSDAAAFISFQHGNGRLHGSKGIGRELYNMAGVLDRARNEVVDRLQLSGKLVLTCDEKDIRRFRMSVVGNAILISNGYAVAQQKIDGNVESFFALDTFLTNLLDQIAGSTSPKAFEGERVTKAAVELYAARDEERRDAIIERFLTQFSRMMSTVQRRLCDPQTIDQDAKELQQRLLKVMSREELDYLSNQPAVSSVMDYSEAERQQVVLVAQEGRGNPLYNQLKLEKRQLTARLGAEFADDVLLPQNDPTEEAENTRQQQLELSLLQNGQQVAVSPRDNHIIHMEVLRQVVGGMMQAAVETPAVWGVMDHIGAHMKAHLDMAEQAGMVQQVADYRQFLQKLGTTLQELHQGEAEAAAAVATGDDSTAGAPPVSIAPAT